MTDLPKVLHVIGPMAVGGAQTQLLGLVRAAHGVHWNATVCATSPGPLVSDFEAAGVPTVVLNRWGSPGLLRFVKLWRFVGRERFDVVNGHLWQGNAYARLAALRPHRPKVLVVEHNVEVVRSRLRTLTDRALAPITDGWVAVTDAMYDFTVASHPTKDKPVVRIPYGLDQTVFRPVNRRSNQVPRIGSMGRLAPEKGFDVLIEAVRLLHASGEQFEVQVAGAGPLLQTLQDRAGDLPLEFVGSVPPGEPAADFLRSLDVFVLPSTHREARPVVVLEALCCGVPVVATDIPGMLETTAGGGTIVAPSDPTALAQGITAALRDEGAPARARQAAASFLDYGEVAAQYRALFDRLIRL